MKKIRTLKALTDTLDAEFAWRLKELADVKILVRQTPNPLKDTMIRAGIPLTYAHWEGFVKTSVNQYLNFITNQNIKIKDLQPCLVALSKKIAFMNLQKLANLNLIPN